jgi:hypothetical protein
MDLIKYKTEIKHRVDKLGLIDDNILSKKLERAMLCLEIVNDLGVVNFNELTLANNWIEPYWWADDRADIKKFGEIALRYFYSAFEKDQVPADQVISIKYLMGEINRRVGNREKAIELFDEVLAVSQNDEKLKEIYNLALQQKTDPKENIE